MATTAAVVGCTGLVGSNILSTLLSHPLTSTITAISRRAAEGSSPKLSAITSTDSHTWGASLQNIQPPPGILFSGLGTTRAAAGGFDKQKLIDYDLNVELATAAKKAGIEVYVLISSHGADSTSRFGYPKMKGELEDAVKALDFEKTVIVRPGLIVGNRGESRPLEMAVRTVANVLGGISAPTFTDWWAQDAETIAKAAVNAGLTALNGEGEKVQILRQADIVRLGRTEWKQ